MLHVLLDDRCNGMLKVVSVQVCYIQRANSPIPPMEGPGTCNLKWKFAGLCDGQISGGFQGREVFRRKSPWRQCVWSSEITQARVDPKWYTLAEEIVKNTQPEVGEMGRFLRPGCCFYSTKVSASPCSECVVKEHLSSNTEQAHPEIPQLWNMRGNSRIKLKNGRLIDMVTGPEIRDILAIFGLLS